MNKTMLNTAGLFLAMLAVPVLAAAESISPATIQSVYERITPALCLVEYSSEVTNPATGQSAKRDGSSLGVLVSADGLVITHGHLLRENVEPFNIKVKVGRGAGIKTYDATLLKKPEDINLVFLRIKAEPAMPFPFIRFENADVPLGSPLALFGVLGDNFDNNPAVLDSRITSVLTAPRTTYALDPGIPFGFVTSPVMDARGRLVGLVGFDLSPQEGGELYTRSGHPLLYQTSLFSKYIVSPPGEKPEEDPANEAWLGVFTQPLNEDFAAYWNLDRVGGLIVSTVVGDSPAHKIGLRPGDVIISFNGTPVTATQDRDVPGFTKLVRDTPANSTVDIVILRDGETMTLQVALEQRPRTSSDALEYEDKTFGLTVRELTTDVRIALNLADDVQGVIVRRVESGSVAQQGKMRPGVLVLSFGGHPVTSVEDFKNAVAQVIEEKPGEVPVFARLGSVTGFFRLSPRW